MKQNFGCERFGLWILVKWGFIRKKDCTRFHFFSFLLASLDSNSDLSNIPAKKFLIMRYMPRGWGVCSLYFNYPWFLKESGEEGIQQSFHNRPWVQELPGKVLHWQALHAEFSSNSVAPFASFNRSSVGLQSVINWLNWHMHWCDVAGTSASLELIKSWNMLDQEEWEIWPDLRDRASELKEQIDPALWEKTAAAWPEVAPMGLGQVP